MTRLLCILLRHPLVPISFQTFDAATPHVTLSVEAERCRCGAVQRVERASVTQFPRSRA